MSIYEVRQLPAPAGSASEPSVAFLGDSNTGIYSPGADQLAISTAGTGRLFVASDGKVGIGASAPNRTLDVAGTARVSSVFTMGSYIQGTTQLDLYGDSSSSSGVRLDSSGRLLVGTSTATANGGVLQVSNGITFPGTQSACSDPNTLDDYEEGTWTPVVTGWTSIAYANQVGNYLKIGRQVTAWFYLGFTGTSAASAVTITGLPFTVATRHNGGAITYHDAPTDETSGINIFPAGTTITFYADNDTAAAIQSNANITTNKFFAGSVTYGV